MRPAVSLSKAIAAAMIPLCIWGLVSSLLLHLIAIRSIFIGGGEGRLRLAVLAFAGGVILLQRLIRTQGESHARIYGLAIGAAMTLFLLYNAYTTRLPVPPLLVFAANAVLFGVLWWTVHRITAACSADSPEAIAAASESGSLAGFRLGWARRPKLVSPGSEAATAEEAAGDQKWAEKLPASHPGGILLRFSLLAIPAFGFGVYLFGEDDPHRDRLGLLLFLYLWCALALLFLGSLSQLSTYFRERGAALPESVGLTWLSMGFSIVTLVLIAAFFLPQPESVTARYVRERMQGAYRGWEASSGFREESRTEGAPRAGRQDGGGGAADASAKSLAAGSGGGQTGSGGPAREGDGSRRDRVQTRREADAPLRAEAGAKPPSSKQTPAGGRGEMSGLDRFFDYVFRATLWLGAGAAVLVLLALIVAMTRGAAGSLAEFRFRRGRARPPKEKSATGLADAAAGGGFRRFADPFDGPRRLEDGDELIRYLWRATLAWCADCGSPCPPGQTPTEFLGRSPAPLVGFEGQARYLAGLVNFSEFSGQPVPDSARPRLHEYWAALQRHVRAAKQD